MRIAMVFSALTLLVAFGSANAQETPVDTVKRLYLQVTGMSARDGDVDRLLKASKNEMGDVDEHQLFELLTKEEGFIDNRLADFVSRISNEEGEPYEDADDIQAAVLLAVVNDIDLRDIFTKPFFIEDSNTPGMPVAASRGKLGGLKASAASMTEIPKYLKLNFSGRNGSAAEGFYNEGLFVTRGFGERSLKDGTNRRAIRAIYDQFLCTKIDQWKDASLDDFYVGKDIDRVPGDDPEVYQNVCRGCHAPMDAQRGAFAYYDYDKIMNQLRTASEVVPKYTQNSQVFPRGNYVTKDARWEILLTDAAAQAHFGWRGGVKAMTGRGVLSYASTIVNARQFQTCITQRLVNTFCEKSDAREYSSTPEFKTLVDSYRSNGYKTKTLIEKIVSSDLCKN